MFIEEVLNLHFTPKLVHSITLHPFLDSVVLSKPLACSLWGHSERSIQANDTPV
jgi:hypothetical protein